MVGPTGPAGPSGSAGPQGPAGPSFLEFIPSPGTTSGSNAQFLVGSFTTTSSQTFGEAWAMMGCASSGDTATVRVTSFGPGFNYLTLTRTGLLAEVFSTGSVIIPSGTFDVTLQCSSASGSALCIGFRLGDA